MTTIPAGAEQAIVGDAVSSLGAGCSGDRAPATHAAR